MAKAQKRDANFLLKQVAEKSSLLKNKFNKLTMPMGDDIVISYGTDGTVESTGDTVSTLLGAAAAINGLLQTEDLDGQPPEWLKLQMAVLRRAATVDRTARINSSVDRMAALLESAGVANLETAFKTAIDEADDGVKKILERAAEWGQKDPGMASFDHHTAEDLAGTLRNMLAVMLKLLLEDRVTETNGLNLLTSMLAVTSRVAARTPRSTSSVTMKTPPSQRKH